MSAGTTTGGITLSVTDGIGRLVLDRPSHKNSLTKAMCLELTEAVTRLDADPDAHPQALSDFRAELKEAYDKGRHPNLTYFVLKRILLDNLYGVDIMPEAVEICKLLRMEAALQELHRLSQCRSPYALDLHEIDTDGDDHDCTGSGETLTGPAGSSLLA